MHLSCFAKSVRLRHWPRPSRAAGFALLLLLVFLGSAEPTRATETGGAEQCPLYPSPHLRMGVNVAKEGGVSIADYDAARLNAGWYHDYNRQLNPLHPNGMIYHQMIRTRMDTNRLETLLGPTVDANPGTMWMVGNEPDRYGQDEMTPAQYAVFYHKIYTFLKQRDPTSRVAVAAIVQATPIRIRYMDMVVDEYQNRYGTLLPTEMWTIHGFNLPEDCGWGAGIPPGLHAYVDEAVPCLDPYSEHANIETFKERIRNFRQWMKEHGYRNHPLNVSEYGILLTPYHGFPHATVRDYMLASFDYMLNATSAQTGYPADGNRLVQQFAWFSLNFYTFDPNTGRGLNGELFDHESRAIKPLGEDFAAYASTKVVKSIDLRVTALKTTAPAAAAAPVTLQSTVINGGGVAATDVVIRFWNGDPAAGGTLLGSAPAIAHVLPDCNYQYVSEFVWTPAASGNYTIFAEPVAGNATLEQDSTNDQRSTTVAVAEPAASTATATVATATAATATATTTALVTVTPTPTATNGAHATATPTPSGTPSAGPSGTSTATGTATRTATGTGVAPTSSATATARSSATPTPSVTASTVPGTTPSATASATATPIATATATVTRAADQVSAVVAPGRAGELRYSYDDNKRIMVHLADNVVDQPTTFRIQLQSLPIGANDGLQFLQRAFTLVAERDGVEVPDLLLLNPVTITVEYSDNDGSGFSEEEIGLYLYSTTAEQWRREDVTPWQHDLERNVLQVRIHRVGDYALFAPLSAPATHAIYLPMVLN